MATFETLRFDNTYARLPEAFFVRQAISPLAGAHMLAWSQDAAALLDLDPGEARRPEVLAFLNGERPLPGADPISMVYAGHQFGGYVPRLGDGRALLLGEVRTSSGELWDLHLKGAGPTPFSRAGDGRAVLRSTIRELLASEAMAGLGIPTTRALCAIGSKTPVYREEVETGALLLRLAPTHVRFGTFEYFAWTRQPEHVRRLADHVIERSFPELASGGEGRYRRFLDAVIERTARLVAQWQAVGFAHGVLNTDNMSVVGLTLDYGPYGFLDDFDPRLVCNHSDEGGRYRFDRQPEVVVWNLARFAEALAPVLPLDQAEAALEAYAPLFLATYLGAMRQKLGLAGSPEPADDELLFALLELMAEQRIDYTLFFRRLSRFLPGEPNPALAELCQEPAALEPWAARYAARLAQESRAPDERRRAMDRVNPKFILRGYLAETAIRKAEQGDATEVARLLDVLRHPFDEQPDREAYAARPPAWGKRLVVSCSS
jgi:uncharacterized protein YdiU (UPF0061 family)